MKRLVALTLVSTLASTPRLASACGGPGTADLLAALQPARGTVRGLTREWEEGRDTAPFRFFDPFIDAKWPGIEPLARLAYESPGEEVAEVPPALPRWEEALAARDFAKARRLALETVNAILDQASPLAEPSAEALRLANEFLDVEPLLSSSPPAVTKAWSDGDSKGLPPALADALALRGVTRDHFEAWLQAHPKSPRAASIALAVAREHRRTQLPDGWPGELGVGEDVWKNLLGEQDGWLAKHAAHPLADLARLQKLRLLYLKGDGDGAWSLLLELRQRRPLRALWEMRHLLVNGVFPKVELAKLDPLLATALVRSSEEAPVLAAATWNVLWKTSQAQATEPWALGLQVRLLQQATRMASVGPLPEAFPKAAAHPSELWAQLRTAALVDARQLEAAKAQAALLDGKEATSALLIAHAYASTGDWAKALAPPALYDETAHYLLDVHLEDATLETLVAKGIHAKDAALALAMRRLGDGQWEAGAKLLEAPDPERAKQWREAEDREGKGDRLAFARWLKEQRGTLFRPLEPGYSRGLKRRLEALRAAPRGGERERLENFLLRSGHRQRALEQYARWLDAATATDAAKVLKEADALYNSLVNWDVSGAPEYEKLLRASAPARSLREAGKRLRKK